MKKILTKSILFVGIVFILIGIIIITSNKLVEKRATFELKGAPNSIVVGHSHACYAFNDSLISNFANVAATGESSFYSYQKVKKIIEFNPSVKNIFLIFTNNQITEVGNDAIWSDMYLSDRYPKYGPFMNKEDRFLIASNNPKGFLGIQNRALIKNTQFLRKEERNYFKTSDVGGYIYLIKDSLMFAKRNAATIKRNTTYSDITTSYVQKIIEFCKSRGVQVFLIRTPLNEKFNGLYNETKFQEIIRTTFNRQDFLDFKDFPIDPNEFGDPEHINYRGAKKFSLFFDQLLKKGLIDSLNKQHFVESEIAKLK